MNVEYVMAIIHHVQIGVVSQMVIIYVQMLQVVRLERVKLSLIFLFLPLVILLDLLKISQTQMNTLIVQVVTMYTKLIYLNIQF